MRPLIITAGIPRFFDIRIQLGHISASTITSMAGRMRRNARAMIHGTSTGKYSVTSGGRTRASASA